MLCGGEVLFCLVNCVFPSAYGIIRNIAHDRAPKKMLRNSSQFILNEIWKSDFEIHHFSVYVLSDFFFIKMSALILNKLAIINDLIWIFVLF